MPSLLRFLHEVITPRVVLVATLILIIGYALFAIGERTGQQLAKVQKERLTLVWPALLELDQRDRALIVVLAMRCDLHETPTRIPDVVHCLRAGVRRDRFSLPKGIVDPEADLERLLAASPNVALFR